MDTNKQAGGLGGNVETLKNNSDSLMALAGLKGQVANDLAKTAEAQKAVVDSASSIMGFVDESQAAVADINEIIEQHRLYSERTMKDLVSRRDAVVAAYNAAVAGINATLGMSIQQLSCGYAGHASTEAEQAPVEEKDEKAETDVAVAADASEKTKEAPARGGADEAAEAAWEAQRAAEERASAAEAAREAAEGEAARLRAEKAEMEERLRELAAAAKEKEEASMPAPTVPVGADEGEDVRSGEYEDAYAGAAAEAHGNAAAGAALDSLFSDGAGELDEPFEDEPDEEVEEPTMVIGDVRRQPSPTPQLDDEEDEDEEVNAYVFSGASTREMKSDGLTPEQIDRVLELRSGISR